MNPELRVLITRDLPSVAVNLLTDAGISFTPWPHERPMSPEELLQKVASHNVLLSVVSDRLDRKFLQAASHLTYISQFGAGFDNIDIAEATRLAIPVSNTPGATSDATADIAFSLMLAVSRKLFYHHRSIAAGQWGYFKPKAHLGFELKGKTLGIFGLGRIGIEVARRCRGAYGMNVIYHNRNRNPHAEAEIGARYVSFDELISTCDILSVHCNLTPETRGLFNMAVFSRMKPSAIFINTSRGPTHNEEDLLEALNKGMIWGAGLDVTNPEPMRPDHPFLTMEQVAVLPHVGSATVETRNEMARMSAANIVEFYSKGTIPNLINPDYKLR